MNPARILAALSLLFLLLFAGRPALAQQAQKPPTAAKMINLQAAEGYDTPSHVCIISYQSRSPNLVVEEKLTESAHKPEGLSQGSAEYMLNDVNWPALCRTGCSSEKKGCIKACEATAVGDQTSCTGDLKICQPRFSLEQGGYKHFAQCTSNLEPGHENKLRVAVLLVNVHTETQDVTEQPYIDTIALDKNQARLSFNHLRESTSRVLVSVIGGHYAMSTARIMTSNAIELPLVRRCQEHEIALPPEAGSTAAKAQLWLGDTSKIMGGGSEPEAECTPTLDAKRRFRMLLPYLQEKTRKTVTVDLGAEGDAAYSRFEGSWFDFLPPPQLDLRYAALSFSWRRHCMYPERSAEKGWEPAIDCPRASLVEAGLACFIPENVRGPAGECIYRCDPRVMRAAREVEAKSPEPRSRRQSGSLCPASKDGDAEPATQPELTFNLPARVRFSGPCDDDVWVEDLVYGNQPLYGFVPPESRHIYLDLENWPLEELQRSRSSSMEKIILRSPDGDVHYVNLEEEKKPHKRVHRIAMPGISCEDVVTYQVISARSHEEVAVPVEHGRIRPLGPHASETWYSFSVFGGFSFMFTVPGEDESDSYKFPSDPMGLVGGSFSFRPRGWAVIFEPRYTLFLGLQSYFPVPDPLSAYADQSPVRAFLTRHTFDVAVLGTPHPLIQIGGALGYVMSVPLFSADEPRLGTLGHALSVKAIGRLQFLPRWSLDLAGGLLIGDEIYRFEAAGFRGAPRPVQVSNVRISFPEIRLRFSL